MNLSQIKTQIDLPRFLDREYGIATNGNGMANCCFHKDPKPSLHVWFEDGAWAWYCHAGCGGGDLVDFVRKKDGLEFRPAVKWICEREGTTWEPEKQKRKDPLGPFVEAYTYTDAEGRELYQIHRFRDPKTFRPDRKVRAEGRVLYHLPGVLVADRVWVLEGEKDVEAARRIGLVATTWPFGVNGWLPQYRAAFYDKDVIISLDRGYRAEEEKVAQDIAEVARSVRIVELPGLTEKDQDISDWIEIHDAQAPDDLKAELERIAAEAPVFGEEYPGTDKASDPKPSPAPAPAAAEKTETFDLVEMEGLDMIPIDWLWYPVAPIGMVGTVLGTPGVGKTYMLADLAARVSRGEPLPVYRKPTEQVASGWVIFITSEGVPDKILKPRLFAASASMKNITVIKGRVTKAGDFTLLDIRYHLDELRELIKKDPRRCVLVIIDPIASFVSGKADLNNMTQTRQALDTVARFAEAAGLAVIVAIHPNKNETQQLQNRAAGSVQMSAAVKTCWIVVEPKPEDPINLRYLSPYKIATAPCDKNQTLPFYLESADFEHNGRTFEVAKIRWSTEIVECNVEAILSPRANDGINLAAKARALIKEQLKDGARAGREILSMGDDAHISASTMYKAKDQLEVDDSPDGFQGPRMWIPPAAWPEKYRGGR